MYFLPYAGIRYRAVPWYYFHLNSPGHAYIFMKSYMSQFFLAAGAVTGVVWLGPGNTVAQLSGIYLAAAVLSFVFLLYHFEKR